MNRRIEESLVDRATDAFDIVRALRRIVRAVSLQSRDVSRRVGLTVAQMLTLRTVAAAGGDGTTATEVRKVVQVSAGTLSGIVQDLVERGLVQRGAHPSDRRRVLLTASAEGQEQLEAVPVSMHERLMHQLESMTPDERGKVLDSLDLVARMLEAERLDASPILDVRGELSD